MDSMKGKEKGWEREGNKGANGCRVKGEEAGWEREGDKGGMGWIG
jgi:hypothetical protein